ncbi:hypothetical protein [Actinophytocola sp. KF-1]
MTARVDRWVALARGPLGRPARGWLVMAGDRGDPVATDAVWDLWLAEPDPRLWAALARWRRPRSGGGLSLVALGAEADPGDVAAAACRTGHPIAATARTRILAGHQDLVAAACALALSTQDHALTAFCVEHHLAPADPRQAAMFFLLTGQDEQYRVADPDHSLLAVAYQGAGEDVRARVRARAAGDPDLVRALADTVRRGGRTRLGKREAAYLVDEFAQRRDWAGVWRLAKDLPVVDAAAAARRCAGWRPADHDAPLFDALAAVDPAELDESRRATLRPVRLPTANPLRGSITPDGRRIAVVAANEAAVYTLPDAGAHTRVSVGAHARILALDADVLVVSGGDVQDDGVCRFPWRGTLLRTADGFAGVVYDEKKNTTLLHLMSGSGRDFRRYRHRVLDVRAELAIPARHRVETCTVAIDPGSGRVAVAANDALYLAQITAGGLRPLATAPVGDGYLRHLGFTGPDRLLRLTWDGTVQLWRLDGDAPRVAAQRTAVAEVADVPGAGVVAVLPRPGSRVPQRVRYLDGETLADVPTPAQFHDRGEPRHLFAAPGGDLLAVGYPEFVEVVDAALVALADRPLAAATPADLHAVRARGPATLFLGLLHRCLAHRFGGDVALGVAGPVTGRADDVALGGSA